MTTFPNVKITAMDNTLLQEHPEIVSLLQKAYNTEYLAWFVYEHAAHLVFGFNREKLITHFLEHAEEEKEHARWVGEKLSALGEIPTIDMKTLKRAVFDYTDKEQILTFIMQLEGEAVSLYSSILPLLEKNAAMRAKIETFVETEQEHFEDFEKMLRDIGTKPEPDKED